MRLREQIRAAGPTIRERSRQAGPTGRPTAKPTWPDSSRTDGETMYRYDEFDHDFVQARVEQFRDQVERRLAGELTEDQFKPLRLMNGALSAAPRLHAAHRHPLWHAERRRQLRKLAHHRAQVRQGYGHFTTRQNLQFNWSALKDVPDILADLAEVEMHAIQTSRQLHPQRHRRPFRRRRRRRDRRSAPLCRDPPPVVDAAPGIHLPAAQVQDRGDRRRARPRGDPGPRHRPAR